MYVFFIAAAIILFTPFMLQAILIWLEFFVDIIDEVKTYIS
jgi:hypothetical protein